MISILLLTISYMLLVLINPSVTSNSVIETIMFCLFKLIPSIFPMMVLCSMVAKSVITKAQKNKRYFLGINACFLPTLLSSWLCGFIIGPLTMEENNSKENLTPYVLLTSNAGIGFVVMYVGYVLNGSALFGILLYVIQLITSYFLFKGSKNIPLININYTKSSFTDNLIASINKSTHSVLEMCGFTVFFSVIRCLTASLFSIEELSITNCILASLLDICSGTQYASQLYNSIFSSFMTGFSVGFGGLCICFQTFSVIRKNIINKCIFIFKKIIQGILCGLFSSVFVYVSGVSIQNKTNNVLNQMIVAFSIAILVIFICCAIYFIKKLLKRKLILE